MGRKKHIKPQKTNIVDYIRDQDRIDILFEGMDNIVDMKTFIETMINFYSTRFVMRKVLIERKNTIETELEDIESKGQKSTTLSDELCKVNRALHMVFLDLSCYFTIMQGLYNSQNHQNSVENYNSISKHVGENEFNRELVLKGAQDDANNLIKTLLNSSFVKGLWCECPHQEEIKS